MLPGSLASPGKLHYLGFEAGWGLREAGCNRLFRVATLIQAAWDSLRILDLVLWNSISAWDRPLVP